MKRNLILLFAIIALSALIFIYLVTRYDIIGSSFSRTKTIISAPDLGDHAFEVETVKTILYGEIPAVARALVLVVVLARCTSESVYLNLMKCT